MPSRAESIAAGTSTVAAPDQAVMVLGRVLHVLSLALLALALWILLRPVRAAPVRATVGASGALDGALGALVASRADSVDVQLDAAPTAVTRAVVRAVRGSGRVVHVRRAARLPAVAIAAEAEWRASGGTRIAMAAASDSVRGAARDAAGLVDSLTLAGAGAHLRTGPVQGSVHLDTRAARAGVMPLAPASPGDARVLLAGDATWETKFLATALEEAGWPVDIAVSLSPKVVIGQGSAREPSRARHAIVLVLPGAPASVTRALPSFVRRGGGVVLVGDAARLPGVGAIRVGAPGGTLTGEAGAEASDEPRHGLDLVPITALVRDGVPLESRDGRTAVAARRIGAGRVLQVGYDNSWVWRMAGGDDAPAAHRRWWSTLLSGIVPMVPRLDTTRDASADTLDAAPLAALVRDLGVPDSTTSVTRVTSDVLTRRHLPLLFVLSLLTFLISLGARRWRGLP